MSDSTETTTGGAETGATDVGAAVASPAVPATPALSLDAINKATGKNFKDVDTFLKSYQDTQSYVGKQQVQKEAEAAARLREQGYMTRSEYETESFYDKNPEAAANRAVIDALAKERKLSAREASQLPEVKSLLEKAAAHDKAESARSVMQSNPRLAAASDSVKDVAEAMKGGNREAAESIAAKAVREAFGF